MCLFSKRYMVARDTPSSLAAVETCPECDSNTSSSASRSERSRMLFRLRRPSLRLGRSS
ncbi:Uncharacterised protein [Vibrio cholerae]|nr:Uncharacterised protein [Vibrio cholerae]